MIPYFVINEVTKALFVSVGITIFILLAFGYAKAIFTGTSQRAAIVSALQTLAVGAAAAGTSYGIVKGVNSIRSIELEPNVEL
jgi:vacuolar iron transporter family protein